MPAFETRKADWVPFRDALKLILTSARPLPPLPTPLSEAVGLALAAPIRSVLTLPPGPSSHMDGYALRGSDVMEGAVHEGSDSELRGPRLRVVGRSLPGLPWAEALEPGSAIRIMTGALLPTGADTVVPVEQTDREESEAGWVRIESVNRDEPRLFSVGQHVRGAGEEMLEGDLLGRPGDTLGFGLLTLLAAAGEGSVSAYPAPRVALLVTGDELVPHGDRTALSGGVRRADVLSPSLPLLLAQAGAAPLVPVRVPDDPDALLDALATASATADLVVTTGGASMGEADLVKRALESLGCEPIFWRIRMRPGSPVSLSRLPRAGGGASVPVLGLPGNPISAIVTCLTLALPAVRAMGGHRSHLLRRIRVVAREPFRGPDHLTRFFRVTLAPEEDGGLSARLAGPQGSGALQSIAHADGLAVVPEGAPSPEDGDPIDVLLLPSPGWVEVP